jgi:hypothetical protein
MRRWSSRGGGDAVTADRPEWRCCGSPQGTLMRGTTGRDRHPSSCPAGRLHGRMSPESTIVRVTGAYSGLFAVSSARVARDRSPRWIVQSVIQIVPMIDTTNMPITNRYIQSSINISPRNAVVPLRSTTSHAKLAAATVVIMYFRATRCKRRRASTGICG